ncbi:hypothetical protein HW132_36085 [Brasilonema sp. CT11]|nr:hypothetical protein [Brasilonema sp. CT11]
MADKFAKDHPEWDGERIYQEARRWVGAFCQAITFNEYSLATTGRALPEYTGYQPEVNPSKFDLERLRSERDPECNSIFFLNYRHYGCFFFRCFPLRSLRS